MAAAVGKIEVEDEESILRHDDDDHDFMTAKAYMSTSGSCTPTDGLSPKSDSPEVDQTPTLPKVLDLASRMQPFLRHVRYESKGPLFLDLSSRPPPHLGAVIKSFRPTSHGGKSEAERSGLVAIGDMVISLNAIDCTQLPFGQIIKEATHATFPLTLTILPKAHVPDFFPTASHIDTSKHRRNSSLGDLPSMPSTPPAAGTSRWAAAVGTKFGQIFDGRTSKRASFGNDMLTKPAYESPRHASFTESPAASVSWTSPPPQPISQPPSPPPQGDSNFHSKFKTWQDSISLEKVSRTSTTLLSKMLPGKRHDEALSSLVRSISIQPETTTPDASVYHTTSLHVVAASRSLVPHEDEGDVQFQWYRSTSPTECLKLRGATHERYEPSLDDTEALLYVQCHGQPRHDGASPTRGKVAVYGPIVLDPSIKETVQMVVEAGSGSFDGLTLLKIAEDECGVVVHADYSVETHIYLDAADALGFVLRFQATGAVVGTRPLESCSLDMKHLGAIHLVAQTPASRDIIALALRTFRNALLSTEAVASLRAIEAAYAGTLIEKTVLEHLMDDDAEDATTEGLDPVLKPQLKRSASTKAVDDAALIADLRRQLASQALVIKATQNERNLMAIAVEVRDRKLDDATAEATQLRSRLEALLSELATARMANERSKKLEATTQSLEELVRALEAKKSTADIALAATHDMNRELEKQLQGVDSDARKVRMDLVELQQQHMKLIEERNGLKAKATGLANELKRLVKGGRSIADIEAQLKDRSRLQVELSVAKANIKRYQDEAAEFEDALQSQTKRRDSAMRYDIARVQSQNAELQRLVAQFSTSLSEKEAENARLQRANHMLLSKLPTPTKLQLQLQKSTSFQMQQQLVFHDDDEDDDSDDEDDSDD
ncbi:hypothetical protein SPRG_08220 [Saprolegnia parasitica CBS 223.65]|uniref:PDZ domain-containing protein n=1 Tax=Saprolegnia parasitica (strain CBS 223.65) TaxID=695850 RepID=A0A067CHX7_SAPPC|nr:hypothetical protein SPRG_08220 [Saprolegnia parasitica CBS 223.65]KDO26417.1 hypothetical protein SPRG_08220 [Saprolegnia parasitica CBS 223.65]|eukprot:XP_012202854.1 hypothetical protein SPRG_08220 [Saprolegnia parasitica CBS 223.65]